MSNRNFGQLVSENNIKFAPIEVTVDGHIVINPTAESYLAADDGPWLPIHDVKPEEKVGVYYVPNGWEQHDDAIWRMYEEMPIVAPVACYKVEEIIYGLIEANALQLIKALVGDYWELFTMRDIVMTDNEIWKEKFPLIRAEIVKQGILTDEQIDNILREALC